ncbi:MAG: hypothetical protein HFG48_01050 [Bacilli bacterium]|nr:hypothetical protein [Bacilli bacterium]
MDILGEISNIDDNTKRLVKIFIIGLVVLIISFLLITVKRNIFDINTEKKIVRKIEKLTGQYYTETLHDAFTLKELEKRSSSGIEIDLYALLYKLKYKKFSDFYLDNGNKKCNLTKTIITLYPKSPYGVKDYTIDVKLDFSK